MIICPGVAYTRQMSGGSNRPEASGDTTMPRYLPADTQDSASWRARASASVACHTPT
ncbi:hypothetical protein D3C78_1396750 [compost metagenome]